MWRQVGAGVYDVITTLNGLPAASMGVTLATGANALEVGDAVKTKIAEMAPFSPAN